MSDTTLNKFSSWGTAAERLAFTPSPPPLPTLYVWYETDTGDTYAYDTSWHLIGGGGAGLVRVATTIIAHADILTLPTTPVDIVAAPGAGFTIMPILVTLQSIFAVAYSGFDATFCDLSILYGLGDLWSNYLADDSTVAVPFTNLSTFLGVTTPLRVPFTRYTEVTDVAAQWGAMANSITLNDNTSLQLVMDNNGAGDLGGGDPANTLVARTYYVLEAA